MSPAGAIQNASAAMCGPLRVFSFASKKQRIEGSGEENRSDLLLTCRFQETIMRCVWSKNIRGPKKGKDTYPGMMHCHDFKEFCSQYISKVGGEHNLDLTKLDWLKLKSTPRQN